MLRPTTLSIPLKCDEMKSPGMLLPEPVTPPPPPPSPQTTQHQQTTFSNQYFEIYEEKIESSIIPPSTPLLAELAAEELAALNITSPLYWEPSPLATKKHKKQNKENEFHGKKTLFIQKSKKKKLFSRESLLEQFKQKQKEKKKRIQKMKANQKEKWSGCRSIRFSKVGCFTFD
jgi:hypothetical protein